MDVKNVGSHIAQGGTVVQWFALWPHSHKVVDSIPTRDLSVWSFRVLPEPAWVLSDTPASSHTLKTRTLG